MPTVTLEQAPNTPFYHTPFLLPTALLSTHFLLLFDRAIYYFRNLLNIFEKYEKIIILKISKIKQIQNMKNLNKL
jgi:hypothetical protein